MKNPLISVVMSAYNVQKFIKVAIDSILNQTYTNFEFIIINDGSTDKTGEIIKSFTDDRIVLIDKPKNAGLIVALNDGIEKAKGEYIARMDADDESLPQRFALQIAFMKNNPDIDVLGTALLWIDSHKRKKISMPKNHRQCLNRLIDSVCVLHPTVMIRKNSRTNIKYNAEYQVAEDYKLWVDLAKNGAKFANLLTPLLKYNQYGENISITQKKEQQDTHWLIQKEYLLYYLKNDFKKELDLVFNKTASLQDLSVIYNALDKNEKPIMLNFFRHYIKKNINSIGHKFRQIHPIFLVYFMRYKVKNWFK